MHIKQLLTIHILFLHILFFSIFKNEIRLFLSKTIILVFQFHPFNGKFHLIMRVWKIAELSKILQVVQQSLSYCNIWQCNFRELAGLYQEVNGTHLKLNRTFFVQFSQGGELARSSFRVFTNNLTFILIWRLF